MKDMIEKELNPKEHFVLLSDAVPDIVQEIRYFSSYNFIGDPIEGYEEPCAILSKEAAAALKKASDIFIENGFRIKVFDAYRPKTAVEHFKRWANDPDDLRMKSYFYPDVQKSDLFTIGYIAEKSSHSRGSTVDITLLDMIKGREVNMGSPFDYFGKRSHADFTKHLSEKEIKNRLMLRDVMVSCGFNTLEEEWWHFTLKNEPFPDTYFDFPNRSSEVK